jgi:hypothetical protein
VQPALTDDARGEDQFDKQTDPALQTRRHVKPQRLVQFSLLGASSEITWRLDRPFRVTRVHLPVALKPLLLEPRSFLPCSRACLGFTVEVTESRSFLTSHRRIHRLNFILKLRPTAILIVLAGCRAITFRSAASSDLDLARHADLHDIEALLELSLTRHLTSPHQLRALCHVWILHHRGYCDHLIGLGVVGDK